VTVILTVESYFATLFEPAEYVWACSAQRLRSRVYSRSQSYVINAAKDKYFGGGAFLSINPAQPDTHRCTANTAACRNFLIEFDVGTIDEQQEELAKSGLPFSCQVLSGGKSLHTIIALEEPVPLEQYKEIHRRLCLLLPKADAATCDPSRFSRFPTAIRVKEDGTSAPQEIVAIRGRVPNKQLLSFLYTNDIDRKYREKYPKYPPRPPRDTATLIASDDILSIFTLTQTLARKYPLTHGVKNRNIGCWTMALCASTSLTDEEIGALLAENDNGNDKRPEEYQYAIQTARKRLDEQERK
jgi:hypothetical protein